MLPAVSKRPLQSRTVWGGLIAVTSALPDLLLAVLYAAGLSAEPIPPERVGAAVLALIGGLGAIYGRLIATARIESRHTL